MEEKQVYISFEKDEYKTSKAGLLKCRANLINIQKSLQQLAAIRSTKKRLIGQLQKSLSSAGYVTNRLNEKMPDSSLPKSVQDKYDKRKKDSKEKIQELKQIDFEVTIDTLDRELREINRKLTELGV